MMYRHSGRSLASIIPATAMVVALCLALALPARAADVSQQDQATQSQTPAAPPSNGPSKSFTEEDVNTVVKKTIDERARTALSCSTIPSSTPISTSSLSRSRVSAAWKAMAGRQHDLPR
jgi:hypothetical protein